MDDAIVVVEAVEHHIEHGLSPKDATLKAMEEVSGPVVGIALVLSAVFVPMAALGGIKGLLNQQFAITIAISVLISAFNALDAFACAGCAYAPPTKKEQRPTWKILRLVQLLVRQDDRWIRKFEPLLIRRWVISMLLLVGIAVAGGMMGKSLPYKFHIRRKTKDTPSFRFNCRTLPLCSGPIPS